MLAQLRYCLNNLPTWIVTLILCTTTSLRILASHNPTAQPTGVTNAQPAVR